MKKYTYREEGHESWMRDADDGQEFYSASDVDARIAALEKGLAAAFRWLPGEIEREVGANEMTTDPSYCGQYLNDLADMRAARTLMVNSYENA
jgi:hypothetical protein